MKWVYRKKFYTFLTADMFDWVRADWTGRTMVVEGGINPGLMYEIRDVEKRLIRRDLVELNWLHEDRLKVVDQEVRVIKDAPH